MLSYMCANDDFYFSVQHNIMNEIKEVRDCPLTLTTQYLALRDLSLSFGGKLDLNQLSTPTPTPISIKLGT